jgi:hypothetical protein
VEGERLQVFLNGTKINDFHQHRPGPLTDLNRPGFGRDSLLEY